MLFIDLLRMTLTLPDLLPQKTQIRKASSLNKIVNHTSRILTDMDYGKLLVKQGSLILSGFSDISFLGE